MKQVIKVMSIMTAILIVFCVFGMRPLPAAAYSVEKAAGISDDVFARNIALPNETTAQSNKHGIVLESRKNMTLTGSVGL